MNKSNAFYVGCSKDNVSQPFSVNGLFWPQNLIKYLGVNVPINNFDYNLLFSENYNAKSANTFKPLVISRSYVVRKNYSTKKSGYFQSCV